MNKRARAERMRRLGGSSVFLGACPLILLLSPMADVPVVTTIVAVAALAVCVWLWIRVPATGVRVEGDRLVVTSWWSRREYPRLVGPRFRAEPYHGLFFVLGWTVYGGRLQSGELVLEMPDGRRVRLGALCAIFERPAR